MSEEIRAVKYYFEEDVVDWVVERIRGLMASGDYLSLGRYCSLLEKEVARYIGTEFCAVCSSGTDSLEIILRTLGVEGGEVVVPVTANPATALAVIRAGARPVFVDSLSDFSPNPELVEEELSRERSDVRAVVAFHGGGFISEHIDELVRVCKEYGAPLVEDASHAFGSELRGVKAGRFGDAGGFSLFSTKVFTTGEGGLITTSNREIYEKSLTLRNYGLEGGELAERGLSSRMTEIQAILGLAQLKVLDKVLEKRREVAKLYREELEKISTVEPLEPSKDLRPNYYKFPVILLNRVPLDRVREKFRENAIQLPGRVFEIPLNKHRALRVYGEKKRFSVAEELALTHITLPIYPQLTFDDVSRVVKTLKTAVAAP